MESMETIPTQSEIDINSLEEGVNLMIKSVVSLNDSINFFNNTLNSL